MPNARILAALAVLLSVIWAVPVRAEEAPPSRVGRVSATEGAVSMRPASGEWTAAAVNDPITTGTALRTSSTARGGLGIAGMRTTLSGASELEVARLDDGIVQLMLKQGRIGIHLARLESGAAIEIDLPQGGVWLLAPGDYDIAAGNDQMPGRVAVFAGQARFAGGGTDRTIAAGSALALNGRGPVMGTPGNAAADDFVAYWRPAAEGAAEPAALHHVSAEMTGWDMLDNAGNWQEAAGIGEVWVPKSVPDDWAPYRYGHWRWVMPWGWSWIDDMPWGFAPSHYGRWARIAGASLGNERWAWVPGAEVAHPVYMPAAVNFLGSAGIGLSGPDPVGPVVAWFPLAPGEAYWPGYTSDLALIRRINAGAVKDVAKIGPGVGSEPPGELITASYQNRRFASVVPRAVFAGGRAVAPALVSLPPERIDNAPILLASPQIMPPASRPVVVAMASAVHTLARILTPHPPRAVARTAMRRPGGRKAYAQTQTRSAFNARVAMSAGRARARAIAAYARSTKARTHLASASRTRWH
jgi:hypothetical protein